MRVSEVSKLSALDRFLYWIRERHNIYLKRKKGKPKPWTDDEVLQQFFFTNPYRENDKTTVWFRENIRDRLKDSPEVLFATVAFRWFNKIETGRALLEWRGLDSLTSWRGHTTAKMLRRRTACGTKVFTGAYMISAAPGSNKVEHVCECLDIVWKDRRLLVNELLGKSLQNAHEWLVQYPYLGGFMAYELVTDLRFTYLLQNARDKLTWCNPGPGCIRGLYWLAGEEEKITSNSSCPPKPKDWQKRMRDLLKITRERLPDMPRFEMREIEHICCEVDKYNRMLFNTGRSKRRYDGQVAKTPCDLRPQAKRSDGYTQIENGQTKMKKPQVAILHCLSLSGSPLSRNQIAKRSKVDPTKVGDYAGPRPPNQTDKALKRWQFPALDTLGYVHVEKHDMGSRDLLLYTITETGKKAIQ